MVTPARLESQVRWLRRLGYRFLTANELLDEYGGGAPEPRTAVLTFDDGWLDALTVTGPLLARLGVRATFYVCPGQWGAQHEYVPGAAGRLLDAGQAGELAERGMELGSHTLHHVDLRLADGDQLARELAGSKAAVEAVTGAPCRTLAYPYGFHDARVRAAAAAAGYELAWAWEEGPWDPFAAPRLPAPPRAGGPGLVLKLAGARRPALPRRRPSRPARG